LYKLVKYAINATITSLKGVQFCLILLALLTMIDFILSLMSIELPQYIQVVFDTIYAIQSLIYKPNMSIIPVDFTLVIAAIVMLLIAGAIVYILNFIIEFEQIFDKVEKDGNRRFEQKFNKQLQKTAENIEQRNKHFAMIYNIEIEQINSQYYYNSEQVDTAPKIAEYTTLFKTEMIQNFKVTSQQIPEGILLFFEDINECNAVFDKLYEFQTKTKETLAQLKLKLKVKSAVCIADRNDINNGYIPKLKKLLNIASPNKIMSLADFKNKYQTLKNQKYKINGLGEYGLENEIIEIYTFEP